MIQFIKKYQNQIGMGLAISVLVLCYFQQKELSKLRNEVQVQKEIKTDNKSLDSLLKKADLK